MPPLRHLLVCLVFAQIASPALAQSNDNFANATVLSGASGQVSGTLIGATREAGEPTFQAYPLMGSVWYRWTAPLTGTATFQLSGKT